MDVYTWVIFMYVAGTVIVGWFLLHEGVSSVTPAKKESLVGHGCRTVYSSLTEECVKNGSKQLEERTEEPAIVASKTYAGSGV